MPGIPVVVVGSGNAALSAAISAAESGAKVRVIEKAPEEFRGGNTRLTGGLVRCAYGTLDKLAPIVGEDALEGVEVTQYGTTEYSGDLARMSMGLSDTTLTDVLVAESFPTVQWLVKQGVGFKLNKQLGAVRDSKTNKISIPPGSVLRARGQGAGLSKALFQTCDKLGIEIMYDTEATQIELNDDGAIEAVRVHGSGGRERIACKSLVLASGGFEANPRMRASYLGGDWSNVLVRGVPYNTGVMTEAALAVGAQPYGDWSACHATIVDIDAPPFSTPGVADYTSRLSYNFGLLLNLEGQRFLDEAENFHHFTYAKFGRAILTQRRGIAVEIFDGKTIPLLAPQYTQFPGNPIEADDIETVARGLSERLAALNFNADAMLKTVTEYNAAKRSGTFDPTRLDGLRTSGLAMDKTNWAAPLDTPPYRAYIVHCGITFTYGGLKIDPDAHVLDFRGEAIPGLFAAGEAVGGLFFGNYPGGAGLAAGAVFGRRAGRGAALYAKTQSTAVN